MKPVAFSLLAGAALFLVAAKAPEDRRISYKMTPIVEAGGRTVLRVDLSFRGETDGETLLHLPSQWAGSRDLWKHVEGLEVRGATRLSGSFQVPVVHHKPGALIRVRYNIRSAYENDPGFAYEKARPIVRPDWFFFHGESVFAAPEARDASPARFRWGRIPKGWKVASDLDHLRREKSSLANLINSVGIGGRELKVVRRQIGRSPLRIATLGKWSFEPEALADLVEPIVEAGDAYWREESTPFLVVLAPLGEIPTGLSYTGTGRTDAFSIASTSGFALSNVKRFLAHEYTHTWLPFMLGTMPEVGEATDYWFSEGFADYVAAKVLLRAGLWTLDDYARDKNEALLRYGTSPVKGATDVEVAERFWRDPNLQQLSYDRGHLLAARLDAEIAARSEGKLSLDDVLRAQRKASTGNNALATELFVKMMAATAGVEAGAEVERLARKGEPIALPEDLFGECARLVTERRREFDRGFDADATRIAGGEIAGVDPTGPAYAAGMRNGMVLVERQSGVVGDSSVEIGYRVMDADGERVLRYLPAGKGEHEVQRMVLTVEGAEQEARCKARLAGS